MSLPTITTVPAFRAAVVSALRLHPTVLAGNDPEEISQPGAVPVSSGHPGDTMGPEGIYLGEVDGNMEIPTIRAGRKKRDEDYTVEVVCFTGSTDDAPDAAETRAFELGGALEDILANDPTLAVEGVQWASISAFQESVAFDATANGWVARVTYSVSVKARLQ